MQGLAVAASQTRSLHLNVCECGFSFTRGVCCMQGNAYAAASALATSIASGGSSAIATSIASAIASGGRHFEMCRFIA